ncbi:MAG: hypothetical protein GF375_01485 [Candidatus Omnitrophica bacterium]|nr:hypothetical protein [Candidatus Omnitrophota bacterium]MBD3268802.1 hypothetical protein [Candidatus Omnitrophota bacterium]
MKRSIFLVSLIAFIFLFFFGLNVIKESSQSFEYFLKEWGVDKISCSESSKSEFCQFLEFIQKNTPSDSMLIVGRPSETEGLGLLKYTELCDYHLFPRLTTYEDDYEGYRNYPGPVYKIEVIKGKDKPFLLPEGSLKFRDSYSLIPYDLPGDTQSELKGLGDYKETKPNFLLGFAKLFLIITSGMFLTLKRMKFKGGLDFLITSFLAGLIINSLVYIILSILGIKFTELLQFCLLSLLAAPLLFQIPELKKIFKVKKSIPLKQSVYFFPVAGFFLFLFFKSILMPVSSWDACLIWGIKAKVIHVFLSLNYIKFWGCHPFYVPLLPVSMSQLMIGGQAAVKTLFPLFAFCLYGVIYTDAAGKIRPFLLRMVLPLLIFTSPVFFKNSFLVQPDLLSVVFLIKSVSLGGDMYREFSAKKTFTLAVILSGLVLTRPEGLLYCAVIVSILFLKFVKDKSFKFEMMSLLMPFFIFLLWRVEYLLMPAGLSKYSRDLSYFLSPGLFVETISSVDWGRISYSVLKYSFNPYFWGLIPVIFFLALLLRRLSILKDSPFEWRVFVLSFFGILLFSWTAGYLWGIEFYFETLFNRYHMVPAALIFFISVEGIREWIRIKG